MKVPSGIKSSKFWRLKAAVNGTRKASQHGLSNRVTSIRAFTNGFLTIWTWNSTVTIFWYAD